MSKTIEQQVEEIVGDIVDNTQIRKNYYIDENVRVFDIEKLVTRALQERDRIAREEERNAVELRMIWLFKKLSNGDGTLRSFSWNDFISKALTTQPDYEK